MVVLKSITQVVFGLIVLCSFGISELVQADEPIRLRVLTYNIHHAEGIDGKLDLERIARVILAANPDVVALQEVDRQTTRTNKVDQASELAKLTEFNVAFGANIDLQGGQYGNAVLSRLPIENHKNHFLPNLDGGEQRGVILAELSLPRNRGTLLLLATHFDHRRDDRERVASAQAINKLIKERDDLPALLAGDFNDRRDSETIEILESAWQSVNQGELATIPVKQPSRQIDYIFVRPSKQWKVIDVQVLEEAIASDHRALLATLELND